MKDPNVAKLESLLEDLRCVISEIENVQLDEMGKRGGKPRPALTTAHDLAHKTYAAVERAVERMQNESA